MHKSCMDFFSRLGVTIYICLIFRYMKNHFNGNKLFGYITLCKPRFLDDGLEFFSGNFVCKAGHGRPMVSGLRHQTRCKALRPPFCQLV